MVVSRLLRSWTLYTGVDRRVSADSPKVKCVKVSPVNVQLVYLSSILRLAGRQVLFRMAEFTLLAAHSMAELI